MNKELKQKIKDLIEELNYRTDQKSSEELKRLSAQLYEAAIELVFLEKMPKPEAPPVEATKPKSTSSAEPKVPVVDLFAEMAPESEPVIIQEQDEPAPKVVQVERTNAEMGVSAEQDTSTARSGKTLNDSFQSAITVGFNDRFAFVHRLFDGNEDEYYRVMSQLNGMGSYNEALAFLDNVVKPDYNWKGSEEFELRLKEILEHHFN